MTASSADLHGMSVLPVSTEPFTPPAHPEALLETAKQLEEMGRGAEMLVCVVRLTRMTPVLRTPHIELLAAAFKSVVQQHRTALQRMRSVKTVPGGDEVVRRSCERDIGGISEDAIRHLTSALLKLSPIEEDPGAHVLLHLALGDHHRYTSEVAEDEGPKESAQREYAKAAELAAAWLPATHPLRLGVALNRSILAYEVMKTPDLGVAIANQAFDDSSEMLDTIKTIETQHANAVLDKLRENVAMWTDKDDLADEEHLATAS